MSFEEPELPVDEPSFEEPSFEEPSFEDSEEGLTESELEELEKELDESLGDFDEEIQREQTYAEERANENATDESIGGIGTFETYEGDDVSEGESSSQSSSDSSGSSSSAGGGGESGDGQATRTGNAEPNDDKEGKKSTVPDDIPDGLDDDIVARQIREAAEKETDPVLREKLWEEYRNYKNQ